MSPSTSQNHSFRNKSFSQQERSSVKRVDLTTPQTNYWLVVRSLGA